MERTELERAIALARKHGRNLALPFNEEWDEAVDTILDAIKDGYTLIKEDNE